MNFYVAQRIFFILIVLALVAGMPVQFVFAGTAESPASNCAGAESSATGCCDECGNDGISIDICTPNCLSMPASLLIADETPRPGSTTAEPTAESREMSWRTKPDPWPPK